MLRADLESAFLLGAVMLIDTHCHLDFSCFNPLDENINHWAAQGIQHFVVPSVGPENWQSVLALQSIPNIHVALGIHPCFPQGFGAVPHLEALVAQHHEQLVAIGECGLDRRFRQTLSQQKDVFIAQLQLAQSYELPVIIHSVRMYDEVSALVRQYPLARGGVIHAFQGSQQQAEKLIAQGFKLGIGGAFCWPQAHKLRALLHQLPLESWVLETDAPDMPLPNMAKGENTPATLLPLLQMLTKELSLSIEELSRIFKINSEKAFFLEFQTL